MKFVACTLILLANAQVLPGATLPDTYSQVPITPETINAPPPASQADPVPAEPVQDTAPVDPPVDPAPVDPPVDPAPVDPPVDTAPVDPPVDPAPVDPPVDPAPVDPPVEPAPAEPKQEQTPAPSGTATVETAKPEKTAVTTANGRRCKIRNKKGTDNNKGNTKNTNNKVKCANRQKQNNGGNKKEPTKVETEQKQTQPKKQQDQGQKTTPTTPTTPNNPPGQAGGGSPLPAITNVEQRTGKAKNPFRMAEKAQEVLNEGLVIEVGPGLKDAPSAVKKEDQVLLPPFGGNVVKLGQDEYILFKESEILAKIQ